MDNFTREKYVGGADAEDPFAKSQKQAKRESVEKYKKEAQAMLDSYSRFFTTFAQDISLRFKLSNKFFIDLEHGEVNLAAQWFADQGYTKQQILWANLHELSHFRDLAEDPEGTKNNFDYILAKGKQTGAKILKKWEDAYGASDPDFVAGLRQPLPADPKHPERTMNQVEMTGYKIHHTFYNVFDDVFVNNLVARKAPRFEKEEKGGEEVTRLYEEKLFPGTDYTKKPRHLQFIYKCLREEMIDEAITISPEVQEYFDRKISYKGKSYSVRDILEKFIKPRSGRNTKAGQRHEVLRATLEPIFMELLAKDLDDWQPKKPEPDQSDGGDGDGEKGQGDDSDNKNQGQDAKDKNDEGGGDKKKSSSSANPFDVDYKDYEKRNPDQITADDIKDWMDRKKEKEEGGDTPEKVEPEDGKSPEERAEEARRRMDEEWCKKNRITYESLTHLQMIEAEIAPYLNDLSRLWRKIIFGSSKQMSRGMAGYYKTGELDVPKAIEDWATIQKGSLDEVRTMKRMVSKEMLVRQPELIRVRLVGDLSASMDEAKRHILEQCVVLILSSLNEFNTHLNLTRNDTKSKLHVDTEVWVFGSDAYRIKDFKGNIPQMNERVEMTKVHEKLDTNLVNTYDDKALHGINDSLSADDRRNIEQGKILDIVFEITDGGSSNAPATILELDKLLKSKIVARAFQIGNVRDSERKIFNTIWNERGAKKN